MEDNYVDIFGIAPENELDKIPRNHSFSEMCKTYNFHIPKAKPDIHKILKLFIDTTIKEVKTIDLPWGKRTIIEGMLHIKVFYSADKYSKNVYFVYIDVPIYTFLAGKNINDVNILIEHAVIHRLDSRNISISCLLFVYPKLQEMDFDREDNGDIDETDIDKDKNENSEAEDYHKAYEDNVNFNSEDELEFNIEYDMNSSNYQEDYEF